MLYYHFYSISYFIFGNWSGNPKSNLVLIFLEKNSPMSHEGIHSHKTKLGIFPGYFLVHRSLPADCLLNNLC